MDWVPLRSAAHQHVLHPFENDLYSEVAHKSHVIRDGKQCCTLCVMLHIQSAGVK